MPGYSALCFQELARGIVYQDKGNRALPKQQPRRRPCLSNEPKSWLATRFINGGHAKKQWDRLQASEAYEALLHCFPLFSCLISLACMHLVPLFYACPPFMNMMYANSVAHRWRQSPVWIFVWVNNYYILVYSCISNKRKRLLEIPWDLMSLVCLSFGTTNSTCGQRYSCSAFHLVNFDQWC